MLQPYEPHIYGTIQRNMMIKMLSIQLWWPILPFLSLFILLVFFFCLTFYFFRLLCITWADVTQLKISHAPHNHEANTSNKSILALYTMVELWQKAIINNGAVAVQQHSKEVVSMTNIHAQTLLILFMPPTNNVTLKQRTTEPPCKNT